MNDHAAHENVMAAADAPAAPALRRLLGVDALTCGVTGVALALGAAPLASLLALPVGLLREAGILLLPFTALLAFLATRASPARAAVQVALVANAAWVVASIALLASGLVVPNALGEAFVVAQALAVTVLTALELRALGRLPAAIAA